MSAYLLDDGTVDPAFTKLMVTLAEALGVKLSESRIRIYASLLGDVQMADLKVAFRRSASERASGFFPSVGEIRQHVGPSIDDAALLAWAAFGQAASSVGSYSSVLVEDGAAAVALKAVFGSWAEFCATEDGPALSQRRQEFLAAYRAARRLGTAPVVLTGLLPPPPGELAGRTWGGHILTTGQVLTERLTPALTEGRGEDPQAGEGGQGSAGTEGDRGGPAEGGEPRWLLPSLGGNGDGVMPGTERVGTFAEPSEIEDDGPAAGGSPHDRRKPDGV